MWVDYYAADFLIKPVVYRRAVVFGIHFQYTVCSQMEPSNSKLGV